MLSKSFFVVRIKKLEKPLDKKLLIKKLSRRLDRVKGSECLLIQVLIYARD